MAILTTTAVESVMSQQRKADALFKRWSDDKSEYYQRIFADRSPALMSKHLKASFQAAWRKLDPKKLLDTQQLLLNLVGQHDTKALKNFTLDAAASKQLDALYKALDSNIPAFLQAVRVAGGASEDFNEAEEKQNFNKVIDKYIAFSKALFAGLPPEAEDIYLVAIANRFVEFMALPDYQKTVSVMTKTHKDYSLLRMMVSIFWSNLAGDGWRYWHANTLDALHTAYTQGKEVVYIAGGCDVYHLLKRGIYNIRVVDPMLPTQPRYYVPAWEWFIKGTDKNMGVGDRIVFDATAGIYLRRGQYEEYYDVITVKDKNKKMIKIPQSTTQWFVEDKAGKKLGTLTIDRRFCNQDDFKQSSKTVLLMSFNELYYIVTANRQDSWGVRLPKLDPSISLYIKQLRTPITLEMMHAMHALDKAPFQFIKWGTCVT
jgi:hypothetical protein